MNRVLARQLRRLGLDADAPPGDVETWQKLLYRVASYYESADQGRYLLERSLRISSQEMQDMYARLEEHAALEVSRRDTHFETLFSQLPVATFQEDFTAVGAWLDSLRASGVTDISGYLLEHPEELRVGVGLVRVVDVNDAAVKMLRIESASSLRGNSPSRSKEAPALTSYIPQFEAVWRGVGHVHFEYAAHRGAGEPFYGLLHWSAPELDGRLDLGRVIVSIADITERRIAEHRMEDLVRSKDDFLASVSHELRTPLTTVYGSAEALLDQWEDLDREVQRELVGFIARESAELSHLVEDLLVAAQADLGTVSIVPEATPISEIADWIVASTTGLDGKHLEIGDVSGTAWADPLRLKQILRNLVTNAVRYGGRRIVLESTSAGGRCILSVADDGPGVPADRHDAIFDLYERGQPEGGLAGSVGVGLAVSRSLARLMGGDLDYEYAAGWSRFRLDLPAVASAAVDSG